MNLRNKLKMRKKINIGRENENWLAKYVYRKISGLVVPVLANLGVTSVQVSFIGIITSIIAGFFFSFGNLKSLILGYIFLQLTLVLDHVDGAIARYTNNQTMVGSWFDKFSNKLHRFLFVLGVTLGVYKTTGDPFYLILGNISGFLWIFALYISETKRIFFKFKDDITLFKESGNRQIFPFTLIVSNIFGILVLSNNPAAALWFVAIISLNAFKQIYSAHKYWSKEKY